MRARAAVAAGLAVALILLAGRSGRALGATAPVPLGHCSWSFFADPRALVHGDTVLTGCITMHGTPVLVRSSLATGEHTTVPVFKRMEVDDHNNPAVVFWRGRLWVFSSPHSGHTLPRDRRMFVHYRVSREPYGLQGGFGPVHSVPLAKGCGLGYTYPNAVVSGGRLYVFLRGPCWQPIFTWTADGLHWARERTLVRGAPRRRRPHRPYAKYDAGPDGIAMIFSEAHPYSYPTSLYYMRMQGGRFYRADGSLIGRLRDLPFRPAQLDRVYAYDPPVGRAWPMDVATDGGGRPVAVYSTAAGDGDRYWYARWDGSAWSHTLVDGAGAHYGDYTNAGAALSHEDPSWVAVARNDGAGGCNEVELAHTGDGGATFARFAVTAGSVVQNFRPVFPRGRPQPGHLLLEWISGLTPTFHDFDTTLELANVHAD